MSKDRIPVITDQDISVSMSKYKSRVGGFV